MAIFISFLIIVLGLIVFALTSKSASRQVNPEKKTVVSHAVRPRVIEEPQIKEFRYFCIKDKGYHVSVWPKDYDQFDVVEFNIAGVTYREGIDKYIGEFVGVLVAEPDNPYDANAIMVLASDHHHVGYVPKDMTADVRKAATLPCPCFCYIGKNDETYFTDCYVVLPNVSPKR